MDKVGALVAGWVRQGLLPGAALSVAVGSSVVWEGCYGAWSDGDTVRPIGPETMFDLASLTKVTATLPVILMLAADGMLSLDDPVHTFLPEFRHRQVTLLHLLRHSAGLPPDLPVVARSAGRPGLANEIFAQELEYTPGENMRYSDLGMIILGKIAERAAGETFDRLAERRVFIPLGMTDTCFQPSSARRERIAATEMVDGAYIVGEVHDEKSFHLGGVSGSAGLFSTVRDMTRYAAWWLQPEKQTLLPAELMQEAMKPVRGRGLGWEVWHDPAYVPGCGASWPVGSFGHTGFTGTSIWLEPASGVSVVCLTHAVHLGRNNRVRELRPILHEAVWSSLISRG